MRSAVTLTLVASGLFLFHCEPRHRGAQSPPSQGTATATVAATTTSPTATATAPTATATAPTATPPVATVAPTATTPPVTIPTAAPPVTGGWPTGPVAIDPALLEQIQRGIGTMLAGAGVPTAAGGDAIDGAIKANAARNAAGFSPAGPISRAKLKQGEHAGMNFTMAAGKCYVVIAAGGTGVTQLGLNLLFPATPPQAVLASDTANGANPILGAGKPLCPPVGSPVRIDANLMSGAGDVGVQVWMK